MRIEIVGTELPGTTCGEYAAVHVGVQRGREVIDLFPGDSPVARWVLEVMPIAPDASREVRGPYVHGPRGSRFLYLSWGTVECDGTFTMFRRIKLLFADIDDSTWEAALRDRTLVAHLVLTDRRGEPTCGAVHPPAVRWAVSA